MLYKFFKTNLGENRVKFISLLNDDVPTNYIIIELVKFFYKVFMSG